MEWRGAPLLLGERVKINRPFVVIGNPQGRRIRLLCEAMIRLAQPPPQVIAYSDLLAGRRGLDVVPPRAIVRFESPGRDFEVEKLFLKQGAFDAVSEDYPLLAPSQVDGLGFDRGRIWYPRQWYLGFCRSLRAWHMELQGRSDVLLTTWPPDIEVLCDKCRCHARCRDGEAPVPQVLDPIAGFDDLVARMEQRHWERAFVKLAHGSSASGAVALHRHRGRLTAFTTVEGVAAGGELLLYNRRPVRTVTKEDEIRRLIDALAPHRLHTEQWLPKATLNQRVFDLRIVTIAGRPRHTVVREGGSPITNLQLGNCRGSLDALLARLPPERWHALQATCSKVAGLWPNSLQLGIDLLLTPGFREHFVLEVNAFGDLLPHCLHDGQSTFEAELGALSSGWAGDNRRSCHN